MEQTQADRLFRSVRYARIGGVCSGIAIARGYSILLTRIVALLIISTAGVGLLAYLLCWALMPRASESSEADLVNEPLRRTMADKVIGGVCGGIATFLRVDPSIVRVVFALCLVMGGIGLIPYLYAWFMMPKDA